MTRHVKERLNRIAETLQIRILTADTFAFGRAKAELEGIKCDIHILTCDNHDAQKQRYVNELGPDKVIAFGNGNNDRLMLKTAKVGIAVCLKEGCAVDAINLADILVVSAVDVLELLLKPKRLKASSLRF